MRKSRDRFQYIAFIKPRRGEVDSYNIVIVKTTFEKYQETISLMDKDGYEYYCVGDSKTEVEKEIHGDYENRETFLYFTYRERV